MTYKKYSKTFSSLLLTSLTIGLISCGGGGGGGSTAVAADPAETLTQSISFAGGTLMEGQPPAPTFTPGGPAIIDPVITDIPEMTPGMNDALSVQIDQIPLDTTSLNINIQFGKTTNQYISVAIDDPNLISDIASAGGSGTLSLPFSVPTSVCDNLDDIKHQIKCYETVELPDGSIVSPESAQDMILACGLGTGYGSTDTYFAEDKDPFDSSADLCIQLVASAELINVENARITAENVGLPSDQQQSLIALGTCPAKYSGLTCVVNDTANGVVITTKFTPLAPPENVNGFCSYNGGTVQ